MQVVAKGIPQIIRTPEKFMDLAVIAKLARQAIKTFRRAS